MAEDISVQILTQASENIQKLCELTTRIDERVKAVQFKQEQLDKRIDYTIQKHSELMQKIAVLESRDEDISAIYEMAGSCSKSINELDKRISKIENEAGKYNERWKGVATFVVQLIWVLLAAYLLTKLNLQAPAVP